MQSMDHSEDSQSMQTKTMKEFPSYATPSYEIL